jgi:hypothetical protein
LVWEAASRQTIAADQNNNNGLSVVMSTPRPTNRGAVASTASAHSPAFGRLKILAAPTYSTAWTPVPQRMEPKRAPSSVFPNTMVHSLMM